jgi:hypothetical protein
MAQLQPGGQFPPSHLYSARQRFLGDARMTIWIAVLLPNGLRQNAHFVSALNLMTRVKRVCRKYSSFFLSEIMLICLIPPHR